MARKLDYFDFSNPRRSKYPWDSWMDGAIWQIEYVDDFTALPKGFMSSLQAKAKKAHRPLQIKLVGDTTIVFRFLPVQNGHAKDEPRRVAAIPRPFAGDE